ncbi:MAG: stalk domain-containing protein [Defluviitaleaceae bacterium]|nr:stalk domain-containing protein [Defluviitaleaceae bacterium]
MKNRIGAAKGFVAGVLVMALLSGTIVMASSNVRELVFGVRVNVDGEAVAFASDNQPFIIDGRTFLPVGAIANALGFDVQWDAATTTVNVTTDSAAVITEVAITESVTEVEEVAEVNPITPAEIAAFQVAWGEGLVAISVAYADEDEDHVPVAANVLDTLYGYADGHVLFKPTVAQEVPFRPTWEMAASYFIGGDVEEADTGFAIKPWTDVVWCPDGMYILNGETALWMGSVYLTDGDGEVTRVEKSIGLYRAEDGAVRMHLHHSSLPHVG